MRCKLQIVGACRTQDTSARFLITDILRAIRDKTVL
jgi:hypothetical protein